MNEGERKEEVVIQAGLRYLLANEDARAWYFSLIAKSGVYNASPLDDKVMYFDAGKRNMGLQLIAAANDIDPMLYIQMITEASNRKKEIDYHERNTSEHTGTK